MKKRVKIARDDSTLSYRAVCPDCKEVVFMVTYEAIYRGPRRESGSSLLLPVIMSVPHDCK
jgi:hypothetical protein